MSRTRLTQILNLTLLASDLQEQLLFLPPVAQRRDPLKLSDVLRVVRTLDWKQQRRLWQELGLGGSSA